MFGTRTFRKYLTTRRIVALIDSLVETHNWDPALLEFKQLKADAANYIGNETFLRRELDPRDSVVMEDSTVVIIERMFGGVMNVEHIADRLVDRLHERAAMIIADREGTTIYDRSDQRLVTFMAGMIDPSRLADPGNRYRNAAYIIKVYSGHEFDAMSLVARAHSIVVNRQEDGTWSEPTFYYVPGREPVAILK